MPALPSFEGSLFLEGPCGCGKTTAAAHLLAGWIAAGVHPERTLVLVPQRSLGQPFSDVADSSRAILPAVMSYGAFVRQCVTLFWPLIIENLPDTAKAREPVFLNNEIAQYYMAHFAEPYIQAGTFDSLHIPRARLIAQILDNMNKAALAGLSLEEAELRLVSAWGSRHSSRPVVYKTASQIARQYRSFCLENSLLDFTLQVELFGRFVLGTAAFDEYFLHSFDHLIVDNVEELGAAAHDLVAWCLPRSQRVLIIYDWDAGYRVFLGADPGAARQLVTRCTQHLIWNEPFAPRAAGVQAAIEQVIALHDPTAALPAPEFNGIEFLTSTFYPQMIQTCIEHVHQLVQEKDASPGQIVILMPYLSDALRFSLQSGLQAVGISSSAYRPSRALVNEPAVRAALTLLAVINPNWDIFLPPADVASAFSLLIDGLDPVRAALLTGIVYRRQLTSFGDINPRMQARIGIGTGERYEQLRAWLNEVSPRDLPPDYYFSRLFGEVLAQPGYSLHHDLDAAHAVDDLIRFARRFRQTVYPQSVEDWSGVAFEIYQLILSGLYTSRAFNSWEQQSREAVFIAPAYTFLTMNRTVDYQFWFDIGHSGWAERLEQPLTHPYALRRDYPAGQAWTDEMEQAASETALRNLILGLLRRCQRGVFAAVSDISESGYEQRGLLLRLCQQMLNLRQGNDDDTST